MYTALPAPTPSPRQKKNPSARTPFPSPQQGERLVRYSLIRVLCCQPGSVSSLFWHLRTSPFPSYNSSSQACSCWHLWTETKELPGFGIATHAPVIEVVHVLLQGSLWLKDQALTKSIWCFRRQHGNSFNILDFPDMPQKIHSLIVFKKKGRIHHWRYSHVCTSVTAGRHWNSTS